MTVTSPPLHSAGASALPEGGELTFVSWPEDSSGTVEVIGVLFRDISPTKIGVMRCRPHATRYWSRFKSHVRMIYSDSLKQSWHQTSASSHLGFPHFADVRLRFSRRGHRLHGYTYIDNGERAHAKRVCAFFLC